MNSKRKGIRGELEAVRALRALGLRARRAQQFQGYGSDGDIVIDGAPAVHVEAKWLAQIGVYKFLDQATRDSKGRKTELVICKANRREIVAVVYLDKLPDLIRDLQEAGLGSTIVEDQTGTGAAAEPAGGQRGAGVPLTPLDCDE